MRVAIHHAQDFQGDLTMPGDKSLGHRALMFGALSRDGMTVRGLPASEDVASTRRCLESLGVVFDDLPGGGVRITPPKAWNRDAHLDAGNSGTTVRLLAGLLAGLGVPATLDGDASLRRRPMSRIADPLRQLGASITSGPGGYLPLQLAEPSSPLQGCSIFTKVASAQVKSAILLAGLHAQGVTTVTEPATSRDHTERLLAAMGAVIETGSRKVAITGQPEPLQGLDLDLPGDISSAAFFLCAAAMMPGADMIVRHIGTNPTRGGLLEVLTAMGADCTVTPGPEAGGEPVADIRVRHCPLTGTVVAGDLVPRIIDELPMLALLATQARGVTAVRDAAELRHKESDRITATVGQLRRLGADITEQADGFEVRGPTTLLGCEVSAEGDHRLAMTLAMAGLMAQGRTVIDGAEVVAVSHPGFWDDLKTVAGRGAVQREREA